MEIIYWSVTQPVAPTGYSHRNRGQNPRRWRGSSCDGSVVRREGAHVHLQVAGKTAVVTGASKGIGLRLPKPLSPRAPMW
jgi:hypothetical protein